MRVKTVKKKMTRKETKERKVKEEMGENKNMEEYQKKIWTRRKRRDGIQ
jgi:hypothetical protein